MRCTTFGSAPAANQREAQCGGDRVPEAWACRSYGPLTPSRGSLPVRVAQQAALRGMEDPGISRLFVGLPSRALPP